MARVIETNSVRSRSAQGSSPQKQVCSRPFQKISQTPIFNVNLHILAKKTSEESHPDTFRKTPWISPYLETNQH